MLISLHGSNSAVTADTFTAVQTVVAATATKIELPESATKLMIKHMTSGATVWLGEDTDITATGTTVWPLNYGDTLVVDLKSGNNNNLYGIVSSGTITIYVAGVY